MVEPIIECQRDFRDGKVLMVDLKCVCVCIKVHKGEFKKNRIKFTILIVLYLPLCWKRDIEQKSAVIK